MWSHERKYFKRLENTSDKHKANGVLILLVIKSMDLIESIHISLNWALFLTGYLFFYNLFSLQHLFHQIQSVLSPEDIMRLVPFSLVDVNMALTWWQTNLTQSRMLEPMVGRQRAAFFLSLTESFSHSALHYDGTCCKSRKSKSHTSLFIYALSHESNIHQQYWIWREI